MKFLDKFNLVLFSIIILVISLIICLLLFGWLGLDLAVDGISFLVRNTVASNVSLGVAIILILLAINLTYYQNYQIF